MLVRRLAASEAWVWNVAIWLVLALVPSGIPGTPPNVSCTRSRALVGATRTPLAVGIYRVASPGRELLAVTSFPDEGTATGHANRLADRALRRAVPPPRSSSKRE